MRPLRYTLLKSLTNVSRRLPLRAILIIPFVLQIVTIVSITGYLSYQNGQDAVRDLVSQLEQEASDRTKQTLETYLSVPKLVTQINADAARLGLIDPNNIASLEPYLWKQFQQFKDQPFSDPVLTEQRCRNPQANKPQQGGLSFIALASETGNYIDIGFNANNELETSVRDIRKDSRMITWSVNRWGRRTGIKNRIPYDPRQRPWYQKAVQAGSLVWVDPYFTVTDDAPVISADRPLYDLQGNLIGVADATFNLAGIGQFLCNLKVGKTGQIFILEPNGNLIATSTQERPYQIKNQEKVLINVQESQDKLTRRTAESLQQGFGTFSNITRPQELEFHDGDRRRFVKVQPFPLNQRSQYQGLDWLVVVVIPEEEFMAKINENTRITIWLCLLALLVAIASGVATSRWITRPILELSHAAEDLAAGDWEREVRIQRSGELGIMAHAFNHMRQQLKLSHQQLEEYSRGLEQKNQQLETLEAELRRQLNLFLHAVSHDLRNPVIGTAMVLNNLSEQSGNDLKLPRKVLERMQDSNQRQLDLINSLIDTHAAEIWGIALHPEPLALRSLVNSALSDLQPMFDKEQTSVQNIIPEDLPLVIVDPLQLARVYQNLFANALKHNPPGLTITLAAKQEDRWIYCTVSDNGIGIKPEQLDRLFDPYFRGDKRPKSVGLGLGLYLCRQIVEAHGGAIGVESKLAQGTTFWFTLPIG
ncbi:MAG TPA: sensor histidine kinase [Trichocoleus sp.]|jgi:signal transduction histidine kinase